MSVRQQSKWDVTHKMHERYLKAKKKADKTRLLDEFVELTGYDRVYARTLLKHGPPVRKGTIRRAGRPIAYGPQIAAAPSGVRRSHRLDLRQAAGGDSARELIPAIEKEGE